MKSLLFSAKFPIGVALVALACTSCGDDTPELPNQDATQGEIAFEITPPII